MKQGSKKQKIEFDKRMEHLSRAGIDFNIQKKIKSQYKKDEAFYALLDQNKRLAEDWRHLYRKSQLVEKQANRIRVLEMQIKNQKQMEKKMKNQAKEIRQLNETIVRHKKNSPEQDKKQSCACGRMAVCGFGCQYTEEEGE